MSKEAIIRMLEQADREPNLQQELDAAMEKGTDKASAFVAAAAKRGFTFTPKEFADVVAATEKQEITDKDLAHVAGGASGVPGMPTFRSPTTIQWAAKVSSYIS